jgi:RecB family endonuclease NucS
MLVQSGHHWGFASEALLETVVWENLEALLSLKPLQRQYACLGDICDIVAIGPQQSLVIIELKNVEDRYVVQQLTRYYDSLLMERPWVEQIDDSQPVRLVAIAPSFHRHNFVDRHYHRLGIEFLTFKVLQSQEGFTLHLTALEHQHTTILPLSYGGGTPPLDADLPDPPELLLQTLSAYPLEVQSHILAIRSQMLRFDARMRETVSARSLYYDRGQAHCCAEFYCDRKQSRLILFLWLPLWNYRARRATGRHRLWTDWRQVQYMAHIPQGLGQARPQTEWDQIPKEKHPRKYLEVGKVTLLADPFHENMTINMGGRERSTALTAVVEAALRTWQCRLER